eukprot:g63229.t1
MPPGHKKRKTSRHSSPPAPSTPNGLDDSAVSPSNSPHTSMAAYAASSRLATASRPTVDPTISNLVSTFLALSDEIRKLPEGSYTPRIGSKDIFEIHYDSLSSNSSSSSSGDQSRDVVMEITKRTESYHDLKKATSKAAQDIRNEMNKRRQDFHDLNEDINRLQVKLRESVGNDDELLAQLRRVLLVQGQHAKRIKELEAMEEVEVMVDVNRVCSRTRMTISGLGQEVNKEQKTVPLQEPCLMVMGGQDADEEELSSLERLDPLTCKWIIMPSMVAKRDSCACTTLQGKTYVMGGTDGFGTCLSSVERFDPKKNKWEAVAPMTTPRARGCAVSVVLDDKIYLLGGFDGADTFMSSVERFCPEKNKWELWVPLSSKRKAPAGAVLNGYIYVIGGLCRKDEDITLATVERFDTKTNKWEEVAPMISPRSYCAAAVIDSHIYVTGGQDDQGSILSSVERYDASLNKWTLVENMASPRWGHTMTCGVFSFI